MIAVGTMTATDVPWRARHQPEQDDHRGDHDHTAADAEQAGEGAGDEADPDERSAATDSQNDRPSRC